MNKNSFFLVVVLLFSSLSQATELVIKAGANAVQVAHSELYHYPTHFDVDLTAGPNPCKFSSGFNYTDLFFEDSWTAKDVDSLLILESYKSANDIPAGVTATAHIKPGSHFLILKAETQDRGLQRECLKSHQEVDGDSGSSFTVCDQYADPTGRNYDLFFDVMNGNNKLDIMCVVTLPLDGPTDIRTLVHQLPFLEIQ